jgi:hypothetical protein
MNMNTVTIPFRGGLNLASNAQELLASPNEAIRLTNFECSKQGGYRRISGFIKHDDVAVPGTGKITGIKNYHGTIVARDTGVYHSFDESYWLEISKDVTNVTEASVEAAASVPRDPDGRYMFQKFIWTSTEYLFAVDGIGNPLIISIVGDERTGATYRVKEITEGAALTGAKYCTMFKSQLVLAGFPNDPSAFYYSSYATTDLVSPADDDKEIPQEKFSGSTAGSISVGDTITGLKMHREILYIFCENSIWKAVGLETGQPEVQPVTRDIGCLDGFSIQEAGGDLIFLAPDGLRNIKNTERLNDIELGVLSRKVSKILDTVLRNRNRYDFYSTIIREKNQYRLWWTDEENIDTSQRGLIAAYTYEAQSNNFAWAFSELEGLGVTCVDSDWNVHQERVIHGNQAGTLGEQEQGNTFDDNRINYVFQTPYTDFGDVSIRKNIHKCNFLTKPEGDVQMGMEIRYDFESNDVFQPLIYPMAVISQPAVFGDPLVTLGDPLIRFGARDIPDRSLYTEGSGKYISFRIKSLNTIDDAPFDLQSMQVELTAGGKI